MEDSLNIFKDSEMRSRIIGMNTCMISFDFFFGTMLGELLLRHSDNLSRALQRSHVLAAEEHVICGNDDSENSGVTSSRTEFFTVLGE